MAHCDFYFFMHYTNTLTYLLTILHRTDLIIFHLMLQTIIIAPMLSVWGKGMNHPSNSSLTSLQAEHSSWCPTNSVKALKATGMLTCWFVNTSFKLQRGGRCSTKLLQFIHSLRQSVSLNQESTVTSGYATWFTAGGAIHIAHYDVTDDVITRKL